jgi:hypothetical protein
VGYLTVGTVLEVESAERNLAGINMVESAARGTFSGSMGFP